MVMAIKITDKATRGVKLKSPCWMIVAWDRLSTTPNT